MAKYRPNIAKLYPQRQVPRPNIYDLTNQQIKSKTLILFDSTNSNIVVDGNSLSTTIGGGDAWPTQLLALEPFASNGTTVTNYAVSGQTTTEMILDGYTQIDAALSSKNILIVWEARNHLVVDSATVTEAHNALKEYCLYRKEEGWDYVMVCTLLPSWSVSYKGDNTESGWLQLDSDRLDVNTLIKSNYTDYADALIDLASINGLSNLEDTYQEGYTYSATRPTESTNGYFSDGTHLTASGKALIANFVKSRILLLGNSKDINLTFEDVVFTNIDDATASGNNLTSTTGTLWGARGYATKSLTSSEGDNGGIQCDISNTSHLVMIGLNIDNTTTDGVGMSHKMWIAGDGNYYSGEGAGVNNSGISANIGDKMRVLKNGNRILYQYYRTFWTTFRDVAATADANFFAVGLNTNGGTAVNVQITL